MLAPLASVGGRQSASFAHEVEGREASQSGQTEMGSQDDLVRYLFHLSGSNLEFIK